jgi:hypothetical protein
LVRFDAPRKEDEESFETSDKDDPLDEMPGLWDVRYGPRALDVRRGSGDCERLWLLGGDGVLPGCCPANRSSHMMDQPPPTCTVRAGELRCRFRFEESLLVAC